jgi:hypothetical protein
MWTPRGMKPPTPLKMGVISSNKITEIENGKKF